MKQRLSALQTWLQFYYPVARLIFFTAPLAYLLLQAHIIQTSIDWLAAFALSHLLLLHVARARLQGKTRFTVLTTIRETALASYLLLPTTYSLVRTELGKFLKIVAGGRTQQEAPFDWLIALPYLIVLTLNLAGFCTGALRLLFADSNEPDIALLYLSWSAINLMLLAAMLAVAEEARQIRLQTHRYSRLRAMIKLPSGRTMSCETKNFPDAVLALKLPAAAAIESGSALGISIFHGEREFSFPALAVSRQDTVLQIQIEAASQDAYRAFATAVFARGPDWPQWLPHRDADRPWAIRVLITTLTAVLDFATNIGKHLRWPRIDSWFQLGKKKK